jgi:hypothetical protein
LKPTTPRLARRSPPGESRPNLPITTIMLTAFFLLVLAGLTTSAVNDLRHTSESSNNLISNI